MIKNEKSTPRSNLFADISRNIQLLQETQNIESYLQRKDIGCILTIDYSKRLTIVLIFSVDEEVIRYSYY